MTHTPPPASSLPPTPPPTPYDQFPYRGRPCTESHPSRLYTAAVLLGLSPAPAAVDRCRVLELACGDGSNLLSIAESLPAASCLGIDLAARHIEAAQADARALGLTNVRFQQGDLLTLKKEDLGEFDYILAHGLYSWVPRPVQDGLLSLCKQHLAPGGVAFVSYNVLPGWRVHSILRDFMLFHTHKTADTGERLKGTREALALFIELGKSSSGEMLRFVTEYAAVFQQHLESLGEWADSLLLYDALTPSNTPVYFSKFAGHVQEHGLKYLAEADFNMPMPGVLPAEVLDKIGDKLTSQVDLEQYIDFYRMRMFRQSLLCHAEAELPGTLDAAPVSGLYVSALAQAEGPVDPTDGAIARRILAVTVAPAGDVWVALTGANGVSGAGLIAHRDTTGTWSFVRAAAIANVGLRWIGVSPTGDVWSTGLAVYRLSNGTVSTFPVAGEITGDGAILPDGGVVLPVRTGFAEWNGQGFVAHELGTTSISVAAFAAGRVWLGGTASVILSR